MNFVAAAQEYAISTYAGGGIAPIKSIPALQASINGTSTITADVNGNLYFTNGNAVFRLDASGTITRIAGSGAAGFSGDGGPATIR